MPFHHDHNFYLKYTRLHVSPSSILFHILSLVLRPLSTSASPREVGASWLSYLKQSTVRTRFIRQQLEHLTTTNPSLPLGSTQLGCSGTSCFTKVRDFMSRCDPLLRLTFLYIPINSPRAGPTAVTAYNADRHHLQAYQGSACCSMERFIPVYS